MSSSTRTTQPLTKGSPMEANCIILWGTSENGYDLEVEIDDYVNYLAYITQYSTEGRVGRKILMMSKFCPSNKEATRDLDERLTKAVKVKREKERVEG